MSNVAWLGVAFAVVWIAVGVYVLRLARAQRDITHRLEQIERSAPRPPSG